MKRRVIQIALFFLAVGIVITTLIGYVQRRTIAIYEQNIPYIKLGQVVKGKATEAHLALEEYKGGDASITLEGHVLPHLKSSVLLLSAAYDGKPSELGEFGKLDNEDTRALLKETILSVEKLTTIAEDRFKSIEFVTDSTGRTTVIDSEGRKFNNQFDLVQGFITRLDKHVNEEVESEASVFTFYAWSSIVLLLAAFGGITFFIVRLQTKSDNVVAENDMRIQEQGRAVASLSTFVEAISAGDFTAELDLAGDTSLATSLLKMRDKLRENADSDRKRNWSTTGLAQIGEILRANTTSTTELYDNIVKFVVKYTKSNQGGLFLLNDEQEGERYLELVACYAFERKKFLERKVGIGEGLVGQCYLEGARIYLVEVPQEYIRITSGLGGSNPNALLIVPLKVNEKIYGVFELATFGKFEEYQIELVEKLAETIASAISTVRINESTRILLEKTQQQAEEMRAQEEEMRQNMEELEATQEEMRRKEKHIEVMLDNEKKRNEFNDKGRQLVIDLSKAQVLLDGKWTESLELISKSIADHLSVSRVSIFAYDDFTNSLIGEKTYLRRGKTYSSGTVLNGKEHPLFLKAVSSVKTIAAKDAHTHAETRDLGSYLTSSGIQSILTMPYLLEGKASGVIVVEHDTQTDWTDDYIEFLKAAADLVTVTKNTVKINSMVTHLSEAQETLQTIIDNLPRAVFWKDRDLRIQGCNKIFAGVAGMKSHLDMIGKTDFDMPWKDRAEEYRADDSQVMNSGVARIDHEERLVGSDGKESWVLTSKVPFFNKEGEVVGVLGMFEDITDRKRKEADVDLKLKELEMLRGKLEKQKS